MNNKRPFILILLILLCLSLVMGDTITLKTGDRIEGIILSMNSEKVRIKDPNGIILEIETGMIDSIDYSSQQDVPVETEEQMNGVPSSYQSAHHAINPEPVAVSPINPYPTVYYE